MTKRYILDNEGNPKQEPNLIKWAQWFEDIDNRQVATTIVGDDIRISTVFLALDHDFTNEGPPILFETMVFGGKLDDYQRRYVRIEEARAGHEATVEKVKREES